jgi:hypothetical protein
MATAFTVAVAIALAVAAVVAAVVVQVVLAAGVGKGMRGKPEVVQQKSRWGAGNRRRRGEQ